MQKILILFIALCLYFPSYSNTNANPNDFDTQIENNNNKYNSDTEIIKRKIKNSSLEIQRQKEAMENKFNETSQKMKETNLSNTTLDNTLNLNTEMPEGELNKQEKQTNKPSIIETQEEKKGQIIIADDNDIVVSEKDVLKSSNRSNLSFYISFISLIIFIIMVTLFYIDKKKKRWFILKNKKNISIIVIILLGILISTFYIFSKQELKKPPESDQKKQIPFIENNSGEVKNKIEINKKNYFLFDSNILLPLTDDTWYLHETTEKNSNEFLILNETNENFTQKFYIKKMEVKEELKDATVLSEVLINGIILSLKEEFDKKNIEMNENFLLANFVKKEANNTVFYWELKNIPNQEDRIQFVRIFKPSNNNFYIVTYTLLNINKDKLGAEKIELFLKQLNLIQLLKEK